MKIAHGTSYEQAAERLAAEVPGWDFDGVHKAARGTWAQLLNRVRVTGGSEKQRKLFYSTLFQSFASPRLIAAKGEKFADTNGKVQVAAHDRYSPVPFRSAEHTSELQPLMRISYAVFCLHKKKKLTPQP